jgi:hypothetical protein
MLPDGSIEIVERFDGSITLKFTTINLNIDATLVFGSARGGRGDYSFFAIYVGAELPAGIPILNTGQALYGMAGLFALNTWSLTRSWMRAGTRTPTAARAGTSETPPA